MRVRHLISCKTELAHSTVKPSKCGFANFFGLLANIMGCYEKRYYSLLQAGDCGLKQRRMRWDMNALRTLLLVLLLTACSTRPHGVLPHSGPPHHPSLPVWIINHGWHTGIIVRAHDLYDQVPGLRQRFPDTPYLELGWGDQRFYQANEFSYSLALQAILWPTTTVMHVVAVSDDPQRQFPHSAVRNLCLTPQQLQSLLQFLAESFADTKEETLTPLGPGLYGDSAFFPGAGTYHAFNTCNQWTAKGLLSMGMPITPAFHLRANNILHTLDQRQSHHCTAP